MSFIDEQYIRQTFELAKKGRGSVSPNPLVGCVIVRNGQILATGFHKKYGGAHAELDAIQNADCDLTGATLYCNLEPCCHTNKQTPPCAQRIIDEKIARVVVSNLDPNPLVAGRGLELLKLAGIEVESGVLENEGSELNEIFFKNMKEDLPFVHLKIAQTLDGKIATHNGDSKWITNEFSRLAVHQMRKEYDAVLIGAETLRQDNPYLTIRLNDTVTSPIRVVVSQTGKLPLDSHLFSDEFSHKTIVALSESAFSQNEELIQKLEKKSVQVLCMAGEGKIELKELLKQLYHFQIRSIIVEGGSSLFTEFIDAKLYDRISFFIAPKILGDGISSVGNLGNTNISQSCELVDIKWNNYFEDTYLTGKKAPQKETDVHRFN